MAPELSLEDLTPQARTVLESATQQAAVRAAPEVEPPHILLSLLVARNNLVVEQLTDQQVNPEQLTAQVTALLPPAQSKTVTTPTLGVEGQRVVRSAFKEAVHLGHRRVDALHLLLGMFYLTEGPVPGLLQEAGLSLYQLRQNLLQAPKRFKTRQRETLSAHVRPSPIFLALVAVMAICGVALWLGPGGVWAGPLTTLFVLSGWIVSVCLHEFGHALAAYLGGDTAVAEAGYLTLNPLLYSHPLLSIIVPVIFLLMGGIGLPGGAVYIRPNALRSKGWEALTSAAGPLGTLLFCCLISIPFYFSWHDWVTPTNWYFWPALAFLAFLQVTALLFNLLPIPPLDGFQLLATQLPSAVRQQAMAFGSLGFLALFMLFSRENPITDAFWHFAFTTAACLQIPVELVAAGYQQFAWWN